MLLRSLEDALAVRARFAAGLRVDQVDGPAGSWELADGALRHRSADYFRIVARRTPDGPQLFIRQPEPALVGLVVCGPPGDRRLLLNARAEPGLHGLCQFSTTIQSTPANYERRHGGRPTPFLATVLDPEGRVLHDSMQYDWGQYYHRKTKRILVVEVDELVPADEPLCWVESAALDEMLLADHLATPDLRVAAEALAAADDGLHSPAPPPEDHARDATEDVALDRDAVASSIDPTASGRSRSIAWVRTTTSSREVDEWVQPLLVVAEPLVVRLALREGAGGWEAAVALETREGLDGGRLWYPAPAAGGRTVSSVSVSAEGGRFLRHPVRLDLTVDAEADGWLSVEELRARSLAPRSTSVELRLLLGLVRVSGGIGLAEPAG